jgi:hypothetical protein
MTRSPIPSNMPASWYAGREVAFSLFESVTFAPALLASLLTVETEHLPPGAAGILDAAYEMAVEQDAREHGYTVTWSAPR